MPKKSDSTSSGRNHVERSPTAPVLAGSLGHELQGHANERAQHFFYFVVTMKLVIAELNAIGGEGTPWQSSRFVSIKATEQIGSGLRGDAVEYNDFVKTNGGVVDQPTTHFADRDAAHFCNLGLKAGFDAACKASAFTRDGFERLKAYAGNTMELPQKVNLGPDRAIDVLHGELAVAMLDDDTGVVFSRERAKTYRDRARAAITTYIQNRRLKSEFGLVACAGCYLAAYDDDFRDRVYRRVYPEIIGLCESSAHFRGQAHKFLA